MASNAARGTWTFEAGQERWHVLYDRINAVCLHQGKQSEESGEEKLGVEQLGCSQEIKEVCEDRCVAVMRNLLK